MKIIQSKIRKILTGRLLPSANYIYGFADLGGLLPDKFKLYTHGICVAVCPVGQH
jgi:hypothetical protein